MASFNKFQPFVANVSNKVFNLGSDSLKIALTNSVPLTTYGTLSQVTEISYTNLSARTITTTSSTQTAGVYKLILADLILTASGAVATFRYVVLYDDTATNDELIGWYDYGSAVTMANGDTFTIDFDATTGVIQLT